MQKAFSGNPEWNMAEQHLLSNTFVFFKSEFFSQTASRKVILTHFKEQVLIVWRFLFPVHAVACVTREMKCAAGNGGRRAHAECEKEEEEAYIMVIVVKR